MVAFVIRVVERIWLSGVVPLWGGKIQSYTPTSSSTLSQGYVAFASFVNRLDSMNQMHHRSLFWLSTSLSQP